MYIVLNNKANLTKQEFIKYQEALNSFYTSHKIILCPSFTNISMCNSLNYELGSQDISIEDEGSYTGEVVAQQLTSFNIKYVIVGHSERRSLFNEDNNIIKQKIKKALENNIKVILCVGESKEEKETGNTNNILEEELKVLEDINLDNIIVAYEPIYSIGTDIIPSNDEINGAVNFIKSKYSVPVLYGGSVDESNVSTLSKCNIDGYLLGRVSLEVDKLKELIGKVEN